MGTTTEVDISPSDPLAFATAPKILRGLQSNIQNIFEGHTWILLFQIMH